MAAQIKPLLTILALLASTCLCATEMDSAERKERQVDRAALASQDQAIASIEGLAKKQEGSEREMLFLAKVVEAHQQAAKIEFRLSHSDIQDDGLTKSLPPEYHRRLKNVIAAASQFIAKFPDEEGVEPAYFARAEAYRELSEKPPAEKDYELITARFPKSPWAERANLALGALAVEAGDYAKAIVFLKRVESLLSEQFPFVLHQIAWAYFNLNDIPNGISHLKRRNDYYRYKEANSEQGKLSSPDYALQEQGLKDIVAFYFSRYDKGDPEFPLRQALTTIRSAQPGRFLGKMLVHMSNLLKSRDRLEGLEQWTGLIIEEEFALPEAIDVAVVLLEYATDKKQLDRGAVEYLRKLSTKIGSGVRTLPSFPKALNLILQGAAGLQEEITKEKNPVYVTSFRRTLFSTYDAFLFLAEVTHPSYVSARYNRAEILFAEEAYTSAANEYRWLVEHGDGKPPMDAPFYSLKAVVSDFRVLLKGNLIPKDLTPGKLEGAASADPGTLPAPLRDWVNQVRAHLSRHGRQPSGFEEFEYEAYRVLYANGQSRAALAEMGRLAKASPRATVAMPAAKFALDTYLMNSDWLTTREFAEELQKIPALGDEPFRKRLADLPAETSLRTAEQAADSRDFKTAALLCQDFMLKYASTKWAPHALLLASRAALGNQDVRQARQLLTDLITRYPRAENLSSALLMRGGLAESDFDFDAAAQDLQKALTLASKDAKAEERLQLARRFFLANWLSSRPRPLECAGYPASDPLRRECDKYQGLIALASGESGVSQKNTLENALKGYEENRPIWSAVALKHFLEPLPLKERLSAAKVLAERWKGLDPLIQFTLIATLNRSIPEAFQVSRKSLTGLAPLKANTKSLVKRIGLIREVETSAERIVDLPWAQVKVSLLATIAQVYVDFCSELTRLPPPKNLSAADRAQYNASVTEMLTPFRAKGEAIGTQVKNLAAQSPVNPEAIAGVPGAPTRKIASGGASDGALLKALLEEIRPTVPAGDSPPLQNKLASLWEGALKEGSWARSAFFFQELKEKFKIREATLSAMRALALARAGAKAEALAELEAAGPGLEPSRKRLAEKLVEAWYESSTAPDKAKAHASMGTPGGTQP